eukprot:TRINITY_DN12807_c0_g1_i1.p1 TRINITY_DN12807_c0_g1~~TRINITY_DN12807_c0_g1_i1.p1  ORF type:complete len:1556 (-),score=348.20 TRINITY_DN12807_c0_g1_i1:189-4856(-)
MSCSGIPTTDYGPLLSFLRDIGQPIITNIHLNRGPDGNWLPAFSNSCMGKNDVEESILKVETRCHKCQTELDQMEVLLENRKKTLLALRPKEEANVTDIAVGRVEKSQVETGNEKVELKSDSRPRAHTAQRLTSLTPSVEHKSVRIRRSTNALKFEHTSPTSALASTLSKKNNSRPKSALIPQPLISTEILPSSVFKYWDPVHEVPEKKDLCITIMKRCTRILDIDVEKTAKILQLAEEEKQFKRSNKIFTKPELQLMESIVNDSKTFMTNYLKLRGVILAQSRIRRILTERKTNQTRTLFLKTSLQQRNSTFRELLAKERVYSQNLGVVIREYLGPLKEAVAKKRPILSNTEIDQIFSNLGTILDVHLHLHHELKQHNDSKWPEVDRVGEIFLTFIPSFAVYGSYAKNLNIAADLVKLCLLREKFKAFYDHKSEVTGFDLLHLLKLPQTHVHEYYPLLEKMMQATPSDRDGYNELAEAVGFVEQTSLFLKTCHETAQERAKILNSRRSIRNQEILPQYLIDFDDPNLKLIHEGLCSYSFGGPISSAQDKSTLNERMTSRRGWRQSSIMVPIPPTPLPLIQNVPQQALVSSPSLTRANTATTSPQVTSSQNTLAGNSGSSNLSSAQAMMTPIVPPAPSNPAMIVVTQKGIQRFKKVQCYAFLFNEFLLLCRHKPRPPYPCQAKIDFSCVEYSQEPMTAVRDQLNLVIGQELMTLYWSDSNDSVVWRQKISEQIEAHQKLRVFGKKLKKVANIDEKHGLPTVIVRLIEYLLENGSDTEGLFRVSGGRESVQRLKDQLDKDIIDFSLWTTLGVHVVAAVLKQYFRDLPEPLLTYDLYDPLINCMNNCNDSLEALVQAIRDLIHRIPERNYKALNFLMRNLHEISLKSDKNKMKPGNLAICFSPNLLRPELNTIDFALNSTKSNSIIEVMIEYYYSIFNNVPISYIESLQQRISPRSPKSPKTRAPMPPKPPTNLTEVSKTESPSQSRPDDVDSQVNNLRSASSTLPSSPKIQSRTQNQSQVPFKVVAMNPSTPTSSPNMTTLTSPNSTPVTSPSLSPITSPLTSPSLTPRTEHRSPPSTVNSSVNLVGNSINQFRPTSSSSPDLKPNPKPPTKKESALAKFNRARKGTFRESRSSKEKEKEKEKEREKEKEIKKLEKEAKQQERANLTGQNRRKTATPKLPPFLKNLKEISDKSKPDSHNSSSTTNKTEVTPLTTTATTTTNTATTSTTTTASTSTTSTTPPLSAEDKKEDTPPGQQPKRISSKVDNIISFFQAREKEAKTPPLPPIHERKSPRNSPNTSPSNSPSRASPPNRQLPSLPNSVGQTTPQQIPLISWINNNNSPRVLPSSPLASPHVDADANEQQVLIISPKARNQGPLPHQKFDDNSSQLESSNPPLVAMETRNDLPISQNLTKKEDQLPGPTKPVNQIELILHASDEEFNDAVDETTVPMIEAQGSPHEICDDAFKIIETESKLDDDQNHQKKLDINFEPENQVEQQLEDPKNCGKEIKKIESATSNQNNNDCTVLVAENEEDDDSADESEDPDQDDPFMCIEEDEE